MHEANAMRLRLGCEFQFETERPVATVMLVAVRSDGAHEIVQQARRTQPTLAVRDLRDAFSNNCWRLEVPAGRSSIRYDATVDVDDAADQRRPGALLYSPADVPDEVLGFTLPSRYAESDQVADAAWALFGDTPATWERVQAICDWVHANVAYDPAAVVPHGSARQLLDGRRGVCRDFALLVTAFCRAMNIPARYTFGYLPDIGVPAAETPMDFHAWTDVFIANQWFTFDARHNTPRVGRVVVGYGRDAADVAMTTSYGALTLHSMRVWAEEAPTPSVVGAMPTRVARGTHDRPIGVVR